MLITRLLLAPICCGLLAQSQDRLPPDPHENPGAKPPTGDEKPTPKPSTSSPRETPVPTPAAPPVAVTPPSPPNPANTADLLLGTWVLVLEKSQYKPGPAPKSQTREYRRTRDGIEATITTVRHDGAREIIAYRWDYDGKEYPVTGSTRYDTISLKSIDDYTAEATLRHASKVIASARRKIDESGRSMTIEVIDNSSEDGAATVKAFYEKR